MAAPLDPVVTRARIVDAAMSLFAERGYAGVSTRQLGRRAAVNIATLNYHFGGKQQLYEAVVDEVYRRVRGELAATLRPTASIAADGRARLREIVASFYRALRRERDGVRLILREVLDNGRLSIE